MLELRHHFRSPWKPSLVKAAESAASMGYGTSEIAERGGEYFSVELTTRVVPGEPSILEEFGRILRIADEFGVDYLGWAARH